MATVNGIFVSFPDDKASIARKLREKQTKGRVRVGLTAGERTRWYLLSLGSDSDAQTIARALKKAGTA